MDDLLKTAIRIMLGDKDEEKGDYSLFYQRRLFIDTNGEADAVLNLLDKDLLDVEPVNENDNHCGLVLCYKGYQE